MDHWNALRAAINERGLSALVARSGEQAASNLRREVEDGPSIDTFDPLMSAHMAIMSNAMNVAGGAAMEMLGQRPDGTEWCPLCFVNERNPHGHNYDVWIDRAADDQVGVWRELGGNP